MSLPCGFSVFATAIGDCAVAWGPRGLVGVWLPESNAARLRTRIARRLPKAREQAPSPRIGPAILAITRLLDGERLALRDIDVDDSGLDTFDRRVYAAARAIAPGRVVTYADLAARVGGTSSARSVGQSLGRNPFPIVVPCHRIVASDGGLGGFSAPGGNATKRRLLTIENARLDGPAELFDAIDAQTPPQPMP